MARPSKRTPDRRDIILKEMAINPYEELACDYAGICRKTLERWLDDDEEFCRQFRHAKRIGSGEILSECKKKEPWKMLKAAYPKTFKDHYEIDLETTGEAIVRSTDAKETSMDY